MFWPIAAIHRAFNPAILTFVKFLKTKGFLSSGNMEVAWSGSSETAAAGNSEFIKFLGSRLELALATGNYLETTKRV